MDEIKHIKQVIELVTEYVAAVMTKIDVENAVKILRLIIKII